MSDPVAVPRGTIAVTTYGPITVETTQSLCSLARKVPDIDIKFIFGNLVDKARNEAVREVFQNPENQWIWFFDADMQWDPSIVDVMLNTAFVEPSTSVFDIIGGYCCLRGGPGSPFLPTIDTGTGTWEVHDANQGPKEVIRTGGACLLIKRHVFEHMQYPWFGVRPASNALEIMTEFDNFARIKFDGKNPFYNSSWKALLKCAQEEFANQRAQQGGDTTAYRFVGEDSNFCDKARALGFRILVQTNAVCGHVDRKIITPEDHNNAIKEVYRKQALACGVEK